MYGTLGLENITLGVPKKKKKNIYIYIYIYIYINLPFDMCRWQVEDEDVEVIHGAIANHLLFLTSRPLWRP